MSTFNKNIILSAAILASVASSASVQAVPFGLEARSLGMGNASVAMADIATAALANPAMLSYQHAKEDFSLLLSGGLFIDDADGMIDLIDEFQASATQLDANQTLTLTGTDATDIAIANAQITDINSMINSGNSLGGKSLAPTGSFALVVGFWSNGTRLAFSARNELVLAGGLTNPNFGTPITLLDPLAANATDAANAVELAVSGFENTINNPAFNIVVLNGTWIAEIGLSGAKSFTAFNQKISVGITPKIVSVESFTTSKALSTFGTDSGDLIDSNNTVELGDVTTIDVGFVSEISESTQVGLVIKNLIEDELLDGAGGSVNINRQVRLGLAYRGNLFAIGMDLDLVEADPVIVTPLFKSKLTQNVSLGLEFNAWDFLQIRLGAQKNLADNGPAVTEETLLTAGVGIWIGINIDAAVIASDNSVGFIAQTGFKF